QLGLEPPQLLLTSGDGVREDTEAKHPTVWLRGQSSRLTEYFDGFVAAHSIQVESQDSKNLSTFWLSDDDDGLGAGLGSYNIDGQRHKFKLAMIADSGNEFGVQATHIASEQEIDGNWVQVQTSDRVAKQFLNQFIGYYDGVRDSEARARILAEGVIDTRLGTNPQGHIAMVSERDLQSIWQQTPAVLGVLNLPVVDRDQSQNIFYFKVDDPAGFWSSIFSDNKEAKVKLAPGSYRLVLEELTNGGTSISFTDEDGERLSPAVVGQLYPDFKAAYRSRETQK
ncbi:MAG: outer membrane protein assembly factor BamC, partial [Gammaproteobacteria bacterium]|nr:outer membrane protein assembly factor BamC [Gammaproteobacteria bacterium]